MINWNNPPGRITHDPPNDPPQSGVLLDQGWCSVPQTLITHISPTGFKYRSFFIFFWIQFVGQPNLRLFGGENLVVQPGTTRE